MNKAELIAAIAQKEEVTKKDAEAVVKALADVIVAEVNTKDGKVSLPGIGTFKAQDRPARMVRNPRTKETFMSEACKVPKFTAVKAFKDAVK